MTYSEQPLADPETAALSAGLRYVSDDETPGISRVKKGKGFAYRAADGTLVKDEKTLSRIKALVLPPAWEQVWISPSNNTHLAATGRDAKGRKQYRYNPEFVQVRDGAKYDHVLGFAAVLPKIRKTVSEHLALRGMPREKVIATIVSLLEQTLIRVGNEGYVKENGSFGLTTLRNRHVRVTGSSLHFLFHGKSGKTWRLSVNNRRVAKVVRSCQELPGQLLFQYQDEDGHPQKISSHDVNAYLREIADFDVTAKDFRTWAGTVRAATALHEISREDMPLKKQLRGALEIVSEQLGNTIAVCRKCYVHPAIFVAHEEGALKLRIGAADDGEDESEDLTAEERAVLNFLKRRLASSKSH